MFRKLLLAGGLVVAIATPALAADFYVAQDSSKHKCSIVSKKPDGTKMVMVGSEPYKTKADAKKAMKSADECKS